MSHLKSISIVLIIAMGITQLLIHSKQQHAQEAININNTTSYDLPAKNNSNKTINIHPNKIWVNKFKCK